MNVALKNLLLGLLEKYLGLSMSVRDKRFEVTSHQAFPTNSNMGYPSVSNGVVTFNAADATYNSATAGAGQRLVGIVGLVDFSIQGPLSGGSSLSMSLNYTSPQQLVLTSVNLWNNYPNLIGLCYTYTCDSSCTTCNGALSSNCLTCPSRSPPTSGSCAPYLSQWL